MCSHNYKWINDVQVCILCGLTFPPEGRPFFDKAFIQYYQRKKEKHGRKGR